MDELTARAILAAQRANLIALVAVLPSMPATLPRDDVRAGAVQALGALEDMLGVKRTYTPRDDRRNVRRTG